MSVFPITALGETERVFGLTFGDIFLKDAADFSSLPLASTGIISTPCCRTKSSSLFLPEKYRGSTSN